MAKKKLTEHYKKLATKDMQSTNWDTNSENSKVRSQTFLNVMTQSSSVISQLLLH